MSGATAPVRMELDFHVPRNEWWTQNRRGSWRARYARTSMVRRRARIIARDWANRNPDAFGRLQARTFDDHPVHVTATVHPLTHGRFDPENSAPMVKAMIDALTDERYWPDDDGRHIIGPDYRPGDPSRTKATYRITLSIEEHQPTKDPTCPPAT